VPDILQAVAESASASIADILLRAQPVRKSQQAQTHRGKNVQSVGSLLINNHAATQALQANIMVTEFCVPAGVIEHWTTSRSWSSLASWAWPSCSLSRG